MSRSPSLLALVVSRDLARRAVALDALRGLMIIAMVWVNHPPPGGPRVDPFTHAAWDGWTLADIVFPGFLVAVGAALPLARGAVHERGGHFWAKVLRRVVLLQVINLVLVNFPYYEPGKLVWSGTLSFVGWCYLAAALAQRYASSRVQVAIVIALAGLQALVYLAVPVPGCAPGDLSPAGNAARCVERLAFGPLHEEDLLLLPLLGAIVTTLVGVLVGRWLSRPAQDPWRGSLLAAAVVLLVSGYALATLLPINKTLWTGSYALAMAGTTLVIFAALRGLERANQRSALVALQVAGANSLFFYVFAQGLQRVMMFVKLPTAGGRARLGEWTYEHLVAPWAPGLPGTVLYTVAFLAVCYAAALVLYRRRLFLRL